MGAILYNVCTSRQTLVQRLVRLILHRKRHTLSGVSFSFTNFIYKVLKQVKKFNKKVSQKVLTHIPMCDLMHMSQGVTLDVI